MTTSEVRLQKSNILIDYNSQMLIILLQKNVAQTVIMQIDLSSNLRSQQLWNDPLIANDISIHQKRLVQVFLDYEKKFPFLIVSREVPNLMRDSEQVYCFPNDSYQEMVRVSDKGQLCHHF